MGDTTSKDPLARVAERLPILPPSTEVALQNAVQKPFRDAGAAGEAALSALHGHWLHEPLHAILTDIPIGAWTVTVAADAFAAYTDSPAVDNAADVALIVGAIGAVGAAVTGIVDWSEIKQTAPRRIGTAHAALNTVALSLFAASGFLRRREGTRPLARSLAVAGYLVLSLSAHLGGNLVYEHGIGMQRAPRTPA